MPFLTEPDPRARVKGSRDPLGFEIVWSSLGRRVIRNFTTVTDSMDGFATNLLGHYLAEELQDKQQPDKKFFLDCFLRFEQLSAFARYQAALIRSQPTPDVLGINRVKEKFRERSIHINAAPAHQILSSQKAYGLWGLYTVALQNTGLVEQGQHRLSKLGRDVVEKHFLPKLDDHLQEIRSLVKAGGEFHPGRKVHNTLSLALAGALRSRSGPLLHDFYIPLVVGGQSSDRNPQARLFDLIDKPEVLGLEGMEFAKALIKLTRDDADLQKKLIDIQEIETLLAICQKLFGFLQTQHDKPVDKVVGTLEEQRYDFGYLQPSLNEDRVRMVNQLSRNETGTRLDQIRVALLQNDHRQSIGLLLGQNLKVMEGRGGDAWARLEGGRVKVKFKYEVSPLPQRKELPVLWMNSYFLNTFKRIAAEVKKASGN